jgi:hypothetical protein
VNAPTVTAPATTSELVTLWQIAQGLAASGKYDAAFTAEEAYARILAGRDLGLTPTDSMVHMHYLDGKFEPSSEVQGALLKAYVGPDGERYDYRAELADDQCYVKVLRRDPGAEWETIGEVVYTMDDAKRAEITDSDFWRRHPRKMLLRRGVSEAIEVFAPHVVHPVHLAVAVPAPDHADVDATVLPVAAGNPAELQRDGDDAHPQTAAGWLSLFTQIVKQAEKRGTTGRIVEALDAAGAPDGENLLQRFAGLPDGNKAHEVIYRLDRNRTRRRERRQQEDGHATG